MNTNIQKALQHLQQANFAGYFEEMDKIVPPSKKTLFAQLRGQFVSGKQDYNFDQQLNIFAQDVASLVEDDSVGTGSNNVVDKVDFSNIKKQIMRGDVKGALKQVTEMVETSNDKMRINQIIMINSRFNSINSSTMSHDEVSRNRAQIIQDLLNLMDDME